MPRAAVLLIVFALVPALPGAAQLAAQQGRATGVVRGVVVDGRTGAPIADMAVSLVPATATGRAAAGPSARSGRDGAFRFDGVTTGTYHLRVNEPGYQPIEREVTLEPGQELRVRLEIVTMLSSLDTLRVLASPLALQRDNTEFGARLEASALRLLPTPYEPTAISTLTPGVSGERIWGGAARESNLYQIDGLALTHPGTGGMIVPLSPSWVEALEVRGLGAGAELGNFQGGIVNVVTRSGTARWQGRVRSSLESHGLNATNFVGGEIGRERSFRGEVEGEIGGPLVRERLFLFAAGHLLREDVRALSRLPSVDEQFLPDVEERTELRSLGKLTWTPTSRDRIDASLALGSATGENWGLDGYQEDVSAPAYRGPSHLWMLSWRRGDADTGLLEVRAAGAGTSERWTADAGDDVPAVRFFAFGDPPTPVFRNAPFEITREPLSRTLVASLSRRVRTGRLEHELSAGAEITRGEWTDTRARTGGLTWRAVRSSRFDADDPATWFSADVLPSDWGGEVDLHAETGSESAFLQGRLQLHERLTLTPGIRWGRWRGELLPGGRTAERFRAVEAEAWDPRVGLILDPLGREDLLIKAHWGRYHQNLLASFFDRAQGGQVFSNRELWYYRGAPFADPATTFTQARRDALDSGLPRFTLQETIRLNETGPVAPGYRQPYVDQWLVGVEKTFGPRVRLEALWINRSNRNLVALQDRNIAANYHRWENVVVTTPGGDAIRFGDGPLVLPALYIPKDAIRRQLAAIADGAGLPLPPGFQLSDTLTLGFEQDFVLDNVPGAYRDLSQIQLAAHLAYPTWGASASVVLSRLEGNFNSVTGYEPGTGYERFWELGAGPYVRPNEQVNFEGDLPGVNPIEIKASVHGQLPWRIQGGAFLEIVRGEKFTPYFTLTGLTSRYFLEGGGEIGNTMVYDVAGQRVFVQPRGSAHYADRATLDLRFERDLPVRGGRWRATVDVFNVWNSAAATRINSSLTYPDQRSGSAFQLVDESALYKAVWERVRPRTIRLGIVADF